MANIEEKIESRVSGIITDLGYKLYDVQYVKEGKDYFLRIFIEKENGEIDLNDCETVNNAITDVLDEEDYIKEQYFLEVSSTGVEKMIRKDKHLKENIGELITVKLFKPIDGSKEFVGELVNFDDENLSLKLEDESNIEIERKNISLIKKFYDWNN
ncbi:MAG: ribosome maturation factor RimP [Clostridia bacterium]|nr:ribosome maturation factor RimP [Clostridia bacterium]